MALEGGDGDVGDVLGGAVVEGVCEVGVCGDEGLFGYVFDEGEEGGCGGGDGGHFWVGVGVSGDGVCVNSCKWVLCYYTVRVIVRDIE